MIIEKKRPKTKELGKFLRFFTEKKEEKFKELL